MKYKIINFGCKVNTYESTYFEEVLIKDGYTEAKEVKDADVVVINTCSVTNVADQKCRKFIRRLKRENDKAVIIACGCSVQNNGEEYQTYGIDILLGNHHKSKIPELYKEFLKTREPIVLIDSNRKQEFDDMLLNKFEKHTRAFIKIQDGCDNFCSYCVIPLLRGSLRSKKFETVINEAKALADNGHKEIVLVGIHTGSYNSDGKDLVDLINEISKIEKVKRIRLSSIEITELSDKFMETLKNNKKLVSHLHIPLQAGSNEILKLMNRKYDKKYFKDKLELIRSIRPDINITTDVIVGFPQETDELFEESMEFCKELEFGKIHVFPYSIRNNTKASLMEGHVKEEIKKKRALQLIRISDILQCTYEKKFLGKEMMIITEKNHQNEIVGFTDNYIKVFVRDANFLNSNEEVIVKLDSWDEKYIYSDFIKKGED